MRTLLAGMWRCAVIGSVSLLVLSTGCKRPTAHPSKATPPFGPKDPDLRVNPAGYHGRHYAGPVYIPRSSPMEDGTTLYSVAYKKGVTVLSKDDTMRHLLAIRADGSYLFDANAGQIARLKADNVVLLSGLALRTVVAVGKTADGWVLKTGPAKITDAIKSGRLEGTYKIDFNRLLAGRNAPGAAEFDVTFSGYNYHIRFTPAADRVNVQATIKYAGSQGALAYEGVGYLSNFVSTIRMQIKDGQVTNLEFLNENLTGQINLKWYAVANNAMRPGAMARITSWPAELFKSAALSKAAYDVPIILGALPFNLKISLAFSFIPDFTSKNSLVEGSKLIKFDGGGGFSFVGGQTRPAGAFQVDSQVDRLDSTVDATGPVGFTAATEAPRMDLAMGWPPTASPVAGYLNFVTSYGIVTNGTANNSPCQTNILAFSVNAGAAYSSANTFAAWPGTAPGTASSVSLWSKTLKSPGVRGGMCPG